MLQRSVFIVLLVALLCSILAVRTIRADELFGQSEEVPAVPNGITDVGTIILRADNDRDGIDDGWERSWGLSPFDPLDSFLDHDGDGLQAVEEFRRGTSPLNPDTDGDGASDSLEISVGTNPLDPASKPTASINAITVTPTVTKLSINPILPQISKQLKVQAVLQDGTVIDITNRGTSYTSSNSSIASVNSQGLVIAVNSGTATITAKNAGFTATCSVTVERFTPTPVKTVTIPLGKVQDLDADGDRLYVAARQGGVYILDISIPESAVILNQIPMEDAQDVIARGNSIYVANGTANMKAIDVATLAVTEFPNTSGAVDLAVNSKYVFLACGTQGLKIVDRTTHDVYTPFATQVPVPNILSIDADERYAVMQVRTGTIDVVQILDITLANQVISFGSLTIQGPVTDVLLSGALAFVANTTQGVRLISIANPAQPALLSTAIVPGQSIPGGLYSTDLALWGNFLFSGDVFYFNAVPFFNVQSSSSPVWAGTINFQGYGDAEVYGVDAERNYVYAAGNDSNTNIVEIAKFVTFTDNGTSPPQVAVTLPQYGAAVPEATSIEITATATDDVAVASVSFYADNQLVGTDSAAPYLVTYKLPFVHVDTPVSIRAEALDFAGNRGISQTIVITNQAVLDTVPPTVQMIKPVEGQQVAPLQLVTLEATASDDQLIEFVTFFVNGQQIGQPVSAPPYRINWTVPSNSQGATFEIKSVATDLGENTANAIVHVVGQQGVIPPGVIGAGDLSLEGQTLFVNGGTLTIDGSHQFLDVYLYNGATLTHSAATLTTESKMDLSARNLSIEAASKIDVIGKGYIGGKKSGNTSTTGRTFANQTGSSCALANGNCSGGSHGGIGGLASGANSVYGDILQPVANGSGGGGISGGGNGGGSIHIHAAGTIIVDGDIFASGQTATASANAGGSGGSIWFEAQSITGGGSIVASGGNAVGTNAGAGGGGRIALYAPIMTIPTTKLSASSQSAPGGASASGGAGTTYIKK